jgi:hypothetical protein
MYRKGVMLDHAGEALAVLVGFWRFVLSGTYRQRKIEEWREARRSLGGRLAIAAEIVVSVVIGLGLPVAIGVVVAAAF